MRPADTVPEVQPIASAARETEAGPTSIVFFDGDCIFCNRSVQTLIELDDDETLRFAPLQGQTARQSLPEPLRRADSLSTLVFIDEDGRLHRKSGAILRVLCRIGGLYACAALALAFPSSWRDAAYDLIARNRMRLLSQKACALPDPADRWRFLP